MNKKISNKVGYVSNKKEKAWVMLCLLFFTTSLFGQNYITFYECAYEEASTCDEARNKLIEFVEFFQGSEFEEVDYSLSEFSSSLELFWLDNSKLGNKNSFMRELSREKKKMSKGNKFWRIEQLEMRLSATFEMSTLAFELYMEVAEYQYRPSGSRLQRRMVIKLSGNYLDDRLLVESIVSADNVIRRRMEGLSKQNERSFAQKSIIGNMLTAKYGLSSIHMVDNTLNELLNERTYSISYHNFFKRSSWGLSYGASWIQGSGGFSQQSYKSAELPNRPDMSFLAHMQNGQAVSANDAYWSFEGEQYHMRGDWTQAQVHIGIIKNIPLKSEKFELLAGIHYGVQMTLSDSFDETIGLGTYTFTTDQRSYEGFNHFPFLGSFEDLDAVRSSFFDTYQQILMASLGSNFFIAKNLGIHVGLQWQRIMPFDGKASSDSAFMRFENSDKRPVFLPEHKGAQTFNRWMLHLGLVLEF